jgi:hypothetical protein
LSEKDKTKTMKFPMYDCDVKLPSNKTLSGYDDLKECSCAYCADSCKAPAVNSYIGFFDGFNGYLVLYVYIGLIVLIAIIWVIKRYLLGKGQETVVTSSRGSLADGGRRLNVDF